MVGGVRQEKNGEVGPIWRFDSRVVLCRESRIAIYMYFRNHAPTHFHAIYGEDEAVIEIATAKVLDGSLPRRALKMVIELTKANRTELVEDSDRAQAGQALQPIDPLD